MATNKISILVFCFICYIGSVYCQPVIENYPVLPQTTELRKKLVSVEQSQVGVREKTGKNDGKEIEMYQRSVGLKPPAAYCAAGQAWSHNKCDIPNPESGFSPNWFRANVVYRRGQSRVTKFEARPGQVVGFWVVSKGRIGHVGMIVNETKQHYETVEFNTNGFGSDEGQGVHRLLRKKESVYIISDFVGYKEILKALKK